MNHPDRSAHVPEDVGSAEDLGAGIDSGSTQDTGSSEDIGSTVDAGPGEGDAGGADIPLPRVAPSAVRAATAGRPLDEAPPGTSPPPHALSTAGPDDGSAAPDPAPPEEPAAKRVAGDEGEEGEDAEERAAEELDESAVAWRAVPLQTRIEALLFAATEPLSVRRLVHLAGDADADDVRGVLEALDGHYQHSARAFSIQEIGGGFQLRTTPRLAGLVASVGRKPRAETLSKAALETLAIVAYRQPVLRADIEKIRGVATGEVLRSLAEKGLVRVAGRADLPGSPLLYGTTPDFLEVFGLRNLKDLPSDRDLLPRPA